MNAADPAMGVFKDCSVLLELKSLLVKEKNKLKTAVTENGGSICFAVNEQCSLVVASDVSNLSSNRLRSIQKYQTPVVGVDYIYSCLERGVLLPVDEYKLDTSSPATVITETAKASLSKADVEPPKGPGRPVDSVGPTQRTDTPKRGKKILGKFRIYTGNDSDLPPYPENFQVAKYSVFEKINSSAWCVLELQSFRGEEGWQYRVVRYWKDNIRAKKAAVKDMLVFLTTSEEALEVYKDLRETLPATGLQLRSSMPPQALDLGSAPLQQLLLEERLNAGSLSQEVGAFVELLWTEALGCLGRILTVPVDKLSLNDVSRAEGLLLQAQRKLREAHHAEASSLLDEVYALLPFRMCALPSAKSISEKLDLCQLIRDVLNVSEMTLRSPAPSCLGKYRALRCSIETVPPSSSEFGDVSALLQGSNIQIQQVLRVCRGVELQTFKSDLGNIKPLLHSSSPSNFVGVLSRGLLLPRVGVEHHGIERTDVGNLGSGIYFSDAVSTSLKYSRPSVTDGSRLLLVCDVALGCCKDVRERDLTLAQAPEGHHSVHGVRSTPSTQSEFEDDEYVVYSPDQVKLKYVVQFSIEGDQLREFSPAIVTADEPCLPPAVQQLGSESEIESIKDPLEGVTAGLLDSAGQQLPLQAVHVKCKLMDLLSQVIIFQKYTNLSSVPIEAKYVFPLADSAAVCGFEAFINGKHVVGQVKEKETARREYKQAIEKGHGAYLMDQDAPDVFTISVGNLPPGATVLIKVTFVSELIIADGSILFSLPGSVAPWQESAALNQTTQVTVEKVCVTDEAAETREFTLDMSVEMPYEISSLKCITHQVKMKRTDCKAVVSVLPGEVMGQEGFQMSITLSEVHLPRMWVEKHPDKDSQACMLVFYPEFDVNSSSTPDEVVLLLDTSESMKGEPLRMAQRIALEVLKTLNHNLRLNVILFGTDHTEAFLTARPLVEARQGAESFIKRFSPVGGSTELWRPLRALSLLPPSRGIRNLLLLSDGHIQNADLTLQLLRDNAQHSRLFTCGLSSTANRHMLRALAQVGSGAFEFFDTKTKHNWAEKVVRQVKRIASPGCSSVSVKWQQFSPTAPPPVQAPKQLHALFNDCHALVYGFVPHCTQATLLGNLSGQELKTMVSTSELQKTKGTFLHRLTARALIRDYEDGSLDTNEAEHEGKKVELKRFIIELSKEFSILSQFTSFVAIEERDSEHTEGFTDIPKLIAVEDVDFLPYVSWIEEEIEDERVKCGFASWDGGSDILEQDEVCVEEMLQSSPTLYSYAGGSDSEEEMEYEISRALPEFLASFPPPPLPPCGFRTPGPPLPLFCPPIALSSSPPPVDSSALTQLQFSASSIASPAPFPPPLLGLPKLNFRAPPPPPPAHPQTIIASSGPSPSVNITALAPRLVLASSIATPPPPPPAHLSPTAASSGPPPSVNISALARQQALASSITTPPPPFPPLPQDLSKLKFGAPPPPPPPAHLSPTAASSGPPPSVNISALARQQALASSITTPPPPFPPLPRGLPKLKFRAPPPPAHLPSMASSSGPPPPASPLTTLFAQRAGGFGAAFGASVEEPLTTDGSPTQGSESKFVREADGGLQVRRKKSKDAEIYTMERSVNRSETTLFGSFPENFASMASSGSGLSFSSSGDRAGFPVTSEPPSSVEHGAPSPFHDYKKKQKLQVRGEPLTAKSMPSPRLFGFKKQYSAEDQSFKSADPAAQKLKWTKIFEMQHSEGYWELATELGELINVNVDLFANVFLKSKGICSLGVTAHADILKLVATLLVLQLMRVEKLEEGKLLHTLFCLDGSSQLRPERWEAVKKAVDWVHWADRQYPCVYSRLEFGLNWESSTRQLLGYESLPPFSALSGLKLQRAPLLVC